MCLDGPLAVQAPDLAAIADVNVWSISTKLPLGKTAARQPKKSLLTRRVRHPAFFRQLILLVLGGGPDHVDNAGPLGSATRAWETGTRAPRYWRATPVPHRRARNALALVPKAAQQMVAATIRTVFVQPDPQAAREQWRRVADSFRGRFPKLAQLLDDAEADVLA